MCAFVRAYLIEQKVELKDQDIQNVCSHQILQRATFNLNKIQNSLQE